MKQTTHQHQPYQAGLETILGRLDQVEMLEVAYIRHFGAKTVFGRRSNLTITMLGPYKSWQSAGCDVEFLK